MTLDTQPPATIGGRYHVLRPIGAGGMADVYEAVHVSSEQRVALKVLRLTAELSKRDQIARLFEQEFLTLAQLTHPRIVAVYDFGVDVERGPFYAMELLDGGDLQQRKSLHYESACSIARDICSALSLLHSRRLLYRDLSPRNVRCTASGAAKLIDFGALTSMGVPLDIVGTPPFIAPEVLQRQALDARTDLFSLGATLYYALTGQHAFPARSTAQLWELWRTSPPAPSSIVATIPEPLDRLVMDLLSLEPAQRPASAAEVTQRLEAIVDLPTADDLNVRRAYMTTPKLVGREDELRVADSALSAAVNGSATGIVVVGDPGIGRSRFLEECALRATVQGIATVRVAAAAGDDGEYAVLRKLGKGLLHAVPDAASEGSEQDRGVLAHLIPELSPMVLSLDELTQNERRERIQAAACAWVVAISQKRPVCLVVDDARRADSATMAMLRRLLRSHADMRLHLVWSLTSSERAAVDLPSALSLLERACEVITLHPLHAHGIEELLSCVFGDVPNIKQLALYVQRTAAGNPRDSLLLLQLLASEGIITLERGSWTLPAQPMALELPSSMVQAIAQRAARLTPSARLLVTAFACEPTERFSFAECCLLAGQSEESGGTPELGESLAAGLVAQADDGYRLAQIGFEAVLTAMVSEQERATQHRRLARMFQVRGDLVRRAKHHLAAGDHEQGLDLMVEAARKSMERTNADLRLYFDEMRALPSDWLALYQDAMGWCERLNRPAREQEALLSRLAGFIPIAHAASGIEGFGVLRAHLDQLVLQVGLDLYSALPDSLDPGKRIVTALAQAKERFDAMQPELQVYEPTRAIAPLVTSVLAALGLISVTNDVEAFRQLPSLTPLVPLAPAFWVVQKTTDGLGARIRGRFEEALKIYEVVLERLSQPDRGGLRPAEHTSTVLRVSLSAGTLEACMGVPEAERRATFVMSEPDFEAQGLMLRHLCELWQGNLRAADRTKRLVEHQVAFARTRNNFDGQYLLGQMVVLALLDDLTALSHVAASAKRFAALHPMWLPAAYFCQGELERVRGAPQVALESLEQALAIVHDPTGHQLWANIAAGHVRVLLELGRNEEAVTRGSDYIRTAEEHGLGYLVNYIRIPLSLALCRVDAESARTVADAALQGFRAIGSRGLNLVLALENRARIALETEGPAAFEIYAAMSSAENEPLSRRMRRARQARRAEGVFHATPSMTSTMLSELRSVLMSTTEFDGAAMRAINLVTRRAAARGGVLYVRAGEQWKRAAWDGDLPHLDAVDDWASVYANGQLAAQDASTSVLDQMQDSTPTSYDLPAGMYVPQMIGHDDEDGFRYTGLLVLAMPRQELSWLASVTEQVSRAIAGAKAAGPLSL